MNQTIEKKPFSLIAHLGGKCPSCGSTDLQKQEVQKGEGAKWRCMNTAGCPAQLATRIQHMCSRGCLDIEGIGEEMAAALAEAMGMMNIDDPMDLLEWTVNDLMAMSWTTASGGTMTFGESRAKKAVEALGRAKSLPLHRWLWALGIPSIGENTSKEISRLFASSRDLCVLSRRPIDRSHVCADAILRIVEGEDKSGGSLKALNISSHLGPVSCQALLNFCEANGKVWTRLQEWGIKSDNYDPIPQASDAKPLFGKTFAITGTLSVGRDEMKALIESKGGKVSGSVSKNTNFLVAGEGGGQKADKARAAGVTILTEAALREML